MTAPTVGLTTVAGAQFLQSANSEPGRSHVHAGMPIPAVPVVDRRGRGVRVSERCRGGLPASLSAHTAVEFCTATPFGSSGCAVARIRCANSAAGVGSNHNKCFS